MQSVTSKDGTEITYEKTGSGPAVILIDGATGTMASGFSAHLATLLSPKLTAYYYDRRGRGASGDTQPFAVEREIDDIQALIDAAGGTACLYGISSGACLALEAALKLGPKVGKLAMYEAPYDSSPEAAEVWHQYRKNLDAALKAGKRGDAVVLFMKLVGVPEDMINGMRNSPMWPGLEAVAPTLAYDAAAMGDDRSVPTDRVTALKTPVLVMDGGANLTMMPFMSKSADALAAALPHAERKTLPDQRHDVDPEVLAPVLAEFFSN